MSATLGNGMLTAEQVRKVLLYHLPHREYFSVEKTDAWQAIADELNACAKTVTVTGITTVTDTPQITYVPERTCNLIEDRDLLHCSNCGGAADKQLWAYWHFCPNCGARVIGVDE